MDERALRIAFVGQQLGPYGGMERRVVESTALAREAGIDVEVLTARPLPVGSPTMERLIGVPATSVLDRWAARPVTRARIAAARTVRSLAARRRLSERELRSIGHRRQQAELAEYWSAEGLDLLRRVDLVHLFGPPLPFVVDALRAAHAAGVPAIYQSVHQVDARYATNTWRRGFIETCNLLDLLVLDHPAQADDFAEHFAYRGDTAIVAQWVFGGEAELLGVPLAEPSARSGPVVIGTLCRFDAVKGLDVLVEAVARVAASGRDVVARLGGTGDEEPRLRALADDLGFADRLELAGYVEDRAGFFDGLDVFVLSSRAEGSAGTGAEAMAAGRSIVSTDVGAMVERLGEGTGLLVGVDDVEAMAAALAQLVDDPEQRRSLAAAARERYLAEYQRSVQSHRLVDAWRSTAARRDRADRAPV